ncbi:Helitron helicase [Phytophthora megakarya]|uniref:Helitron helicase n=1 Tax=Phytophthora megakarya TaxID=4795 RepID=A0A225VVL8_9STRA|nr:Helitron helicase [Phytophthora megakarya]
MVSHHIRHIYATRTRSRRESVQVDNRWVVPYNPNLCQKYDCHVNVEVCSTVQSVNTFIKDKIVKPLFLGNEGGAMALMKTIPQDKIKQYLDARYLSPPEACWTIFKYEMQNKSTDCLSMMKTNSMYISLPMLEFRMVS